MDRSTFKLCDSYLLENVFDYEYEGESNSFESLRNEISWTTMVHRGGLLPRLISLQATIEPDGSVPLYRVPADEYPVLHPFSPSILRIKEKLEAILHQPFNHALIQYYRDGNDYISEHADKTLDIKIDTNIVNVSFGATRTMILKTKKFKLNNVTEAHYSHSLDSKHDDDHYSSVNANNINSNESNNVMGFQSQILSKGEKHDQLPIINYHNAIVGEILIEPRESHRIRLTHNSIFILGWNTNRRYLHMIRPDKRLLSEKSSDELICNGERISITFRYIATYKRVDGSLYGQGAPRDTCTISSVKTSVRGDNTQTYNVITKKINPSINEFQCTKNISLDEISNFNTNTSSISNIIRNNNGHNNKDDYTTHNHQNSSNNNLSITCNSSNADDMITIQKEALYHAFHEENRLYDFEWDTYYSQGFSIW